MKRTGFIYEEMVSVENCRRAIVEAARHKSGRAAVREIMQDVERYARDLSERLRALDFVTPYRSRIIKDGLSGKEREIQVPAFYPDQCAHHAIVQILMPYITRSSYHWSCANIPGRGIDRASKGVERATVRNVKQAKYCVKLDVRKFYPSIPHEFLKERFRQKFKDERALQIIFAVIDSHAEGIPIGNYTSPWFAEFYLQPLDHFIKQECGAKYYIRYADDIVIIGSNKRKLRKTMHRVIEKVEDMGLSIKPNYQLFQIYHNGHGRKIDFVGRCYARGFTTIRKRRALAFMRHSRRIQKKQAAGGKIPFRLAAGFLSRSACLLHTKSRGLRKKYYDPVALEPLKEVIRNESKRKRLAAAGLG